MTTASPASRALWAETRLLRWPGLYRLVSLPCERLAEGAEWVTLVPQGAFAALVLERDEVSLTLPEALAQQVPQGRLSGPLVALTLDLDVDLGVCGYLLPAAERLAQAGISIVPQCAFKKDHLLVPQDRADEAERVLQAWIEACR